MQLRKLVGQPDFKKNPILAVLKRVLWRAHWILHPNVPLVVHKWWRNMEILLPNSASAAPIYYRKLSSEGKLKALISLIKPGMVALDVGAHIGEYTLILAALCGDAGSVFAFEPQKQLAQIIRMNAQLNHLSTVSVHEYALGKEASEVGFVCDERSQGGWIASGENAVLKVPQVSIDDFVSKTRLLRLDFIKLDAAGNELTVLQGAGRSLRAMRPTIMCQVYNPEVIWQRHHYRPEMIIETFREHQYKLSLFDESVPERGIPINSAGELLSYFQASGNYTLTLIATPET